MTRPLDAARLRGPLGDVVELRAWGFAPPRDAAWEPLAPGVEGLPARRPASPLAWHEDAADACLAPLSLYEQSLVAALLPPGARWAPSLAGAASAIGDAPDGATLWSLGFRGFAGHARLSALRGDAECAGHDLEVRTRKLDAVRDWRAMLADLARADLALAALEPSPVDAAWTDDPARPARSGLEEFLLLRAVVEGDALTDALRAIARDPAASLAAASRAVPAHRAVHARPEEFAARALSPADGRGAAREHAPHLTRDVPENRFALYALASMERRADALARGARPLAPAMVRAARGLAERLAAMRDTLSHGALRGVGALASPAPLGSSSLQRRPGYRELLAVWLRLASAPGALAWAGGDRIGLRDAPRLYERWCALTVAETLGFDASACARLAAGGASAMATVAGREVSLASQRAAAASYSYAFRPDLTLACDGRRLHLDAKYQFEDGDGEAPREAVVKMHAYRDAIEGTWGAFALYPGDGARGPRFDAPGGGGVGALALGPGAARRDAQRDALVALVRRFLCDG
jgi:predicted component of viral defense system (DUF524 family)